MPGFLITFRTNHFYKICLCYLEGFVIYGPTFAARSEGLDIVLTCLQEASLTINSRNASRRHYTYKNAIYGNIRNWANVGIYGTCSYVAAFAQIAIETCVTMKDRHEEGHAGLRFVLAKHGHVRTRAI